VSQNNDLPSNYELEAAALTEAFGNILDSLVHEQGFETPIYSVAIDVNGCIMASHIRWDGNDLKPEFVAQYTPTGFMQFPVIFVFVDGPTGRTAKIRIRSPGEETASTSIN
jgi:hypothetical protein